MRKTITFILLFFLTLTASAQCGIDPVLTHLVSENAKTVALAKARSLKHIAPQMVNGVDTMKIQSKVNVRFNADGSLRQLCIIGTLADGQLCPESELSELGVKVTCTVGKLVVMDVPAKSFPALSGMKQFSWLAADMVNQPDNYQARETNKVSYVTGEKDCPELQGCKYDGTDVIVGIIDTGIDFNHIAFSDSLGNSRIKEAVTFSGDSDTPVVTTTEGIDSLTTGNVKQSHGTHTSATAAGSYVGSILKQGMAPGADLVLCDCGSSTPDSHILASASEIIRYADSVGKPVVINLSLGREGGFHDGHDPVPEAFNTLTSEKPGRIIVFSAGNSADTKMSIRKTLMKDEVLKSVLNPLSDIPNAPSMLNYYDGLATFIYSTDGNPFTVEYKAVDISTGDTYSLEEKPIMPIDSEKEDPIILDTAVTKYSNNCYGVLLEADTCSFKEQNLALGIFIKAGSDGQTIVAVDNKAANNKQSSLAGSETFPVLTDFAEGNDELSINCLACTDGVLSVGAFTDRDGWVNYEGTEFGKGKFKVGQITPYSSYGVDDNGRARPDVLSTGTNINSAFNVYDETYFDGDDVTQRKPAGFVGGVYVTDMLQGEGIGDGKRPYYYGSMQGTSMSAPAVTGIIALWLQKKPDLTVAEVRELIKKSSSNDEYTLEADNIPSGNLVQAGNGKIDALRGIELLSGIDPAGIRSVDNAPLQRDDIYYDILGCKVISPSRGIYIRKGRKVVL